MRRNALLTLVLLWLFSCSENTQTILTHPEEAFDATKLYEKAMALQMAQKNKDAMNLFLKAAKKGDVRAQQIIAQAYTLGQHLPQDTHEAEAWTQKAAQQGSIQSQFDLGMLLKNKGDSEGSRFWLVKAASAGHGEAQYALGMIYSEGDGVKASFPEALKWLSMAAKQGSEKAKIRLGLTPSTKGDFNKYVKAAESGDAKSQYSLGAMYAKKKSITLAMKWIRKAAIQGLPKAQYDLGKAYASGEGAPLDRTKAIKWYRLAALQGHTDAKAALKNLEEIAPK